MDGSAPLASGHHPSRTVGELAAMLGGTVEGDASAAIRGVAALRDALPGDLSFLSNPRYAPQVAASRATAILVRADWQGDHAATLIRVENPDKAFAEVVPLFILPPPEFAPGIHPTAIVGEGTELGEGVHIGPYAVIGRGCRIGARCVIEAHVVLGDKVTLGEGTHLRPHVSVREGVRMGRGVSIHNGTVVGSDGFGYTISLDANGAPVIEKVPQLGIVEIGDDVEIGANVTIDRARFGATKIGDHVKIDNLVQIAHNVQIGASSGVVAQVGISGSTHIGSGVMLWGQAGLAGHLDIGDGATIHAQAGVSKNVPAGMAVVGSPAMERREAAKTLLAGRAIERLQKRVEQLEARLRALEAPSPRP